MMLYLYAYIYLSRGLSDVVEVRATASGGIFRRLACASSAVTVPLVLSAGWQSHLYILAMRDDDVSFQEKNPASHFKLARAICDAIDSSGYTSL